jgi:hypothetical protein
MVDADGVKLYTTCNVNDRIVIFYVLNLIELLIGLALGSYQYVIVFVVK